MKYIIHIGSTKTGSSALQKFLYKNRKKLNLQGFNYPEFGTDNNAHHLIASLFHQNSSNLHKEGLKKCNKNDFKKFLDTNTQKETFLSSEYFWNADYKYKFEFINFLKNNGAIEVEIFVYIREITDWLQSQYNQTVKSGNGLGFSQWVKKTIELKYINYYKNLLEWEKAGADKFTVRLYNKNVEDINKDFLTYQGLDLNKFNFDSKLINPSPRTADIELISIMNSLDVPKKDLNNLRGMITNIAPNRTLHQDINHIKTDDIKLIEKNLDKDLIKFKNKYLSNQDLIIFEKKITERSLEEIIDERTKTILKILVGITR
jgi:hypothetical protein